MKIEIKAHLKILRTGAYGSVQDKGRNGYRHVGIPVSGALDENTAKTANILAGNTEKDATLELIGPGWELEFTHDTIIGMSGANWSPEINQIPFPINQNLKVEAGSIVSMKKNGPGRIAYLAVRGGFQTPELMGSRSWHPYLTQDFMLKKNMLLPYPVLSEKSSDAHFQSLQINLPTPQLNEILAEPGPEWNLLSNDSIRQLLERKWTISHRSNRMAYFLEEKLPSNIDSILTSAVWPGIVQLTPSGQMMILMKDAQTTGGYPRILSVSQKELNKIAQMNPGEKFRWYVRV